MTKPVDLDALDKAHAAATPGEWKYDAEEMCARIDRPRMQKLRREIALDCSTSTWQEPNIIEAVAMHNAYPAMSAELRERRAREEEMAAELRALREVAEAAKALVPVCEEELYAEGRYVECGEPATHMDRAGGGDTNHLLCAKHAAEAFESARRAESKGYSGAFDDTPRPLDPDPQRDALRAALAKVPR